MTSVSNCGIASTHTYAIKRANTGLLPQCHEQVCSLKLVDAFQVAHNLLAHEAIQKFSARPMPKRLGKELRLQWQLVQLSASCAQRSMAQVMRVAYARSVTKYALASLWQVNA